MAAKTNWETGDDVTATSMNTLGAEVNARLPAFEKGVDNGVATLDANGKVPGGQLAGQTGRVVQPAPGAAIPARPSLPDGMVSWSLFDAPGTTDGPDPSLVEPNDLVFNLSGQEW